MLHVQVQATFSPNNCVSMREVIRLLSIKWPFGRHKGSGQESTKQSKTSRPIMVGSCRKCRDYLVLHALYRKSTEVEIESAEKGFSKSSRTEIEIGTGKHKTHPCHINPNATIPILKHRLETVPPNTQSAIKCTEIPCICRTSMPRYWRCRCHLISIATIHRWKSCSSFLFDVENTPYHISTFGGCKIYLGGSQGRFS
jgi:hypothetical protein